MKNQLSALIDGEVDIEEADHLVKAMKVDGEVKEAWKHYNLIGDAIRGDAGFSHDLSARIMQALDNEPTVLAVNKQAQEASAQMDTEDVKPRKMKTPMFWSLAASVAAVMFVGLMVFELQLDGVEEMTPVELANSVPMEYLQAHQSVAPSGAAYYIQSASYTEPSQ